MNELTNGLYTTPEQSKRLLELGVPADSADCYIQISECIKYNFDEKHEEIYKKYEYGIIGGSGIFGSELPALLRLSDGSPEYLPCWSVGRLINIYVYLSSHEYVSLIFKKTFTPMDKILDKFEKDAKNSILDFSKLDE